MKIDLSIELFEKAKARIPGGVNSPVRAFKAVGGNPLFIAKGKGAKITDVDGNEYIDYVQSWGPMLFGHSPDFVVKAIQETSLLGTSFGAPTEKEIRIAELICELVPSVQMVRLVNSGTEATMSAIRLARGFTRRDKIVKFEGCYHGHGDSFLIKAGSGALTFGVPTSPGVTKSNAADTLVAHYNDITSIKKVIVENKNQIAAIIIEPIAGNMGVIPGAADFLKKLREVCNEENIILIFDEVISGFRIAKGGAQEYYGIEADLTCFGKIIGGGLPVGAFGGKKEIMENLAPIGDVYQAGTLSGNPLAVSAGIAMLERIKSDESLYEKLDKSAKLLEENMRASLSKSGLNFCINRVGSMLTLFFTAMQVTKFADAMTCDTAKYAKFFHLMLNEGIYLAPSQFEAIFLSEAHTELDIAKTSEVFEKVIGLLK